MNYELWVRDLFGLLPVACCLGELPDLCKLTEKSKEFPG